MKYTLINTINSKLGNYCEVVAITSNVDEEMTDYYDFVINASSSNTTPNFCKSLKVNLFLEENDYQNIIDFANKIKKSKEKYEVANKLYGFFDDRLFEKEHYEQTPKKMISYLCRKFQRIGFADETYESTVLEREKDTPTSFDNYVALHHTINYSTNKNAGAVIINKTPMKWGDFYVNVIILIGINNNMRGEFKVIYKELLKAFSALRNINDLFSSNNAKEFVDQLLQVTTNK